MSHRLGVCHLFIADWILLSVLVLQMIEKLSLEIIIISRHCVDMNKVQNSGAPLETVMTQK